MRYLVAILCAVAAFAVAVLVGDLFGLGDSQAFSDVSLFVGLAIVVAVVRPWQGITLRSKWLSYLTTTGCLALVLLADLYGALWDSCAHGSYL
jgi:hypothetical protein